MKKKQIASTFGGMTGDQVKTAPKGFSKQHPAIDLLRFKQFWFERKFSDAEVLAPGFAKEVNRTYKAIRPFFDYMSTALTTNANGEPILH